MSRDHIGADMTQDVIPLLCIKGLAAWNKAETSLLVNNQASQNNTLFIYLFPCVHVIAGICKNTCLFITFKVKVWYTVFGGSYPVAAGYLFWAAFRCNSMSTLWLQNSLKFLPLESNNLVNFFLKVHKKSYAIVFFPSHIVYIYHTSIILFQGYTRNQFLVFCWWHMATKMRANVQTCKLIGSIVFLSHVSDTYFGKLQKFHDLTN